MKRMKNWIPAFAGMMLLLLAGCVVGCGAAFFSAETIASYEVSPDAKKITYRSNKEQQGLTLDLTENNGIKAVKISVDKAGTAESAVAAALQLQLSVVEMLKTLMPLIEKAAAAGS